MTRRAYLVFSFFMLFTALSISAQDRSCGMVEHMKEQMKNPKFAQQRAQNLELYRKALSQSKLNGKLRSTDAEILVPVAVHYPTGNEADRSCLEALAQGQIDILNADFAASNADISNWDSDQSFYPGVNFGSASVFFCIATSDHPTSDPDVTEGNPAVTIGYDFGGGDNRDSAWAGYLNIVVREIDDLGFSPFPGSAAAGQAVTMDVNSFGSGAGCAGSGIVPLSPFNLGRTVTHEVGHFFNLDHTFTDSCSTDDGIDDTPNISTENYDCPPAGSVDACVDGEKALTMDFMDYVDDACMYMFTEGQTTVVDTYVASVLQPQFKTESVACSLGPNFFITSESSPLNTCVGTSSVTYNLKFTTLEDFSEDTTLSVSQVPDGASVVLSQSSLNSDASFSMTLNNLESVGLGDYFIRITGTSASVTNSFTVRLSLITGACESFGDNEFLTSTEGVIFNTIENLNSGQANPAYTDYTGTIVTDVNRGSAYELSVFANTDGDFETLTTVWIDWNQNCSFDDEGESYDLGSTINEANGLTSNSPLMITIPNNALQGTTVMRVTTKYTDPDFKDSPIACQTNFDGEVEDYGINVMRSLSDDDNEFDNFRLFPNPTRPDDGSFFIRLNSYSGSNITVDMFDMRGRLIKQQVFEPQNSMRERIFINEFQAGLYWVRISDGDVSTTKKVIKR